MKNKNKIITISFLIFLFIFMTRFSIANNDYYLKELAYFKQVRNYEGETCLILTFVDEELNNKIINDKNISQYVEFGGLSSCKINFFDLPSKLREFFPGNNRLILNKLSSIALDLDEAIKYKKAAYIYSLTLSIGELYINDYRTYFLHFYNGELDMPLFSEEKIKEGKYIKIPIGSIDIYLSGAKVKFSKGNTTIKLHSRGFFAIKWEDENDKSHIISFKGDSNNPTKTIVIEPVGSNYMDYLIIFKDKLDGTSFWVFDKPPYDMPELEPKLTTPPGEIIPKTIYPETRVPKIYFNDKKLPEDIAHLWEEFFNKHQRKYILKIGEIKGDKVDYCIFDGVFKMSFPLTEDRISSGFPDENEKIDFCRREITTSFLFNRKEITIATTSFNLNNPNENSCYFIKNKNEEFYNPNCGHTSNFGILIGNNSETTLKKYKNGNRIIEGKYAILIHPSKENDALNEVRRV